jgi:hypothetical protein
LAILFSAENGRGKNSDGTLVGMLLESLSLSQSTLEEYVQVWMVETNPLCKRKKISVNGLDGGTERQKKIEQSRNDEDLIDSSPSRSLCIR